MTAGRGPTPFRATVLRTGEQAELRLEGELDFASVPELSDALRAVLARNPRCVAVHADELEFADVAGLRPLIDLSTRMGPGAVRMHGTPRQISRVLRLLDLEHMLA